MGALRLTLLGGFEARLASGGAVCLPTKKAQALLAYLGLRPGQAHQRDKLAALLWGERSDEHARDSLRHALVVLRKALSRVTPPSVVVEGHTLTLNPAAVEVDVATFERQVTGGTPEALEQATELYRGDLLLGFSVNEALFEDWLMAERERLREVAIDALARLLAHQTSTGGTERAIRTAVGLLALDPLQEPVHRALMRLYHWQGRRGAALKQYRVCLGVLQRELGTEPEAETRQLYQELLQRPVGGPMGPCSSRARPPAGSREADPGSSRLDLPIPEVPLVGRDAELAVLAQAADQASRGEGRIAVVIGETGIGKSALLGALAAHSLARSTAILAGRAHESDQILAFGPWVQALRGGKELLDGVFATLEPVWRAEVARLLPEFDAPGPPPSGSDRRLFEGQRCPGGVSMVARAIAVGRQLFPRSLTMHFLVTLFCMCVLASYALRAIRRRWSGRATIWRSDEAVKQKRIAEPILEPRRKWPMPASTALQKPHIVLQDFFEPYRDAIDSRPYDHTSVTRGIIGSRASVFAIVAILLAALIIATQFWGAATILIIAGLIASPWWYRALRKIMPHLARRHLTQALYDGRGPLLLLRSFAADPSRFCLMAIRMT